MTDPVILAVDQGTSSTKAILLDRLGGVVRSVTAPIRQYHERPGWAEQDPDEIWASVLDAVGRCLDGVDPSRVAGVGLSTQRESILLWERATGRPVAPVIGWQDRRAEDVCQALRSAGHADRIRTASGLPLDPMFSAAKACWLLDTHDPDRRRSTAGELCLGTVDSWLLWRLSGATSGAREHLIEVGNASRTQLLDIDTADWNPWLCERFNVPAPVLPRVVASVGPFPAAVHLPGRSEGVAVRAVLADSHAALFAHGVRGPGQVKATYGTGSSIMTLTGDGGDDATRLARTIAWRVDDRAQYALEGNITSTGATVAWLAKLLGQSPDEFAAAAAENSGGVVIIPAFAGLGAPWWDPDARGMISGLTYQTRGEHLAAAALQSIAFQIEDVVAVAERATGPIQALLADGGPSGNPRLMQLQADISGRTVLRARARDLSALGAAHLAGLQAGVWTAEQLADLPRSRDEYRPTTNTQQREQRHSRWRRELARARNSPSPTQEQP